MSIRHVLPLLIAATALAADAPAAAPKLKPGEAMVLSDQDGKLSAFGEAKAEHPLGGLSQIVWLRLAGAEWSGLDVYFVCSDPNCQPPKGHGRVDMKKALRVDCDAAFLYWANYVREDWIRTDGEGITRMNLVSFFAPFAGDRFKGDGPVPQFGAEWIGRGDLLRTSPAGFMAWWMDGQNSEIRTRVREMIGGFFHGVLDRKSWWFKPAASPSGTWVLGSDGHSSALLYLPVPETSATAVERLKEVLGMPFKKK